MTLENYTTMAAVIGAVAGLVVGLAFGGRAAGRRGGTIVASYAFAFVCISGLVVAHEAAYGKGFSAGVAWALMYSPVDLALSAGAPIVCLLGIELRLGIDRFRARHKTNS
ncbi:MAG: hypothetical protein HYZ53_18200 [Planctomycetes bacterium]|nr:hypothetical protein [Planctomycetota bacterium]